MALERQTDLDEDEELADRDPRQLILPHVDTSTPIIGDRSFRELLPYAPGAGMFVIAVLAVMFGAFQTAVIALLVALPCWLAAFSAEVKTSHAWYLTPAGLFRDWVNYAKRAVTLPWGPGHATLGTDEADDDPRCVRVEGSVERRDGSRATMMVFEGRNTQRMVTTAQRALVRSLTDGVEEDLKDRWFAFYSTSQPASAEDLATDLETRADDMDNDLSAEQRGLLRDAADWLRARDDYHDASNWLHCVIVEATESEVPAPPESIGGRARRFSKTLGELTAALSPYHTPPEEAEILDVSDLLDERVSDVEDMVAGVDDVDIERAPAVAHAAALRSFWTDDSTVRGGWFADAIQVAEDAEETDASEPIEDEDGEESRDEGRNEDGDEGEDEDGDTDEDSEDVDHETTANAPLMDAFESERERDGRTPTERMLTSGYRDVVDPTTLVHGEQPTYARAFWVSEWPRRPEALFLRDLYALRGLNLDVKLHGERISESEAIEALTELILDIDAEAIDRAKKSQVSALTIDEKLEAYIRAFKMFDRDKTTAWRLSGYVVVRADSREQLREDTKEVRNTLESSPASAYPVASGTNQRAAFASAAPFTHDRYERQQSGERTHIALPGAFGAAFPPGTTSIRESGGIPFGRNTQTGELLEIDPWSQATAPHMTMIGWSGAGKTTLLEEVCAWWFLNQPSDEPPRTLIVVDTQGEFGPLTRTCGGEHIPVGANQPLNPMQITAIPQAERERMRERGEKVGDPLAAKVAEFTQFLGNIIRVESRNADGGSNVTIPYQLISYAANKTYKRFDIMHDDLDSHANASPAPKDFVETLRIIREEAKEDGKHTFHGAEGEVTHRIESIDTLLNNMIGFFEDGKYEHLWDTAHTGILDPETRMAYLDASAFGGTTDAENSIAFQQAWSEATQKVKQAPGKTLVVLDEGHLMYQSQLMIEWLEDAARQWRRYGGCLWSVSQSPEEFVTRQTDVEKGSENKRQVVLEQSSGVQVLPMSSRTSNDALEAFGLDEPAIHAAKNELVAGEDEKGYSTCLLQFSDGDGDSWIESRIETVPMQAMGTVDGEVSKSNDIQATQEGQENQEGQQTQDQPRTQTTPSAAADGGNINVGTLDSIDATAQALLTADPSSIADVTEAPQSRVGGFEQVREPAMNGERPDEQHVHKNVQAGENHSDALHDAGNEMVDDVDAANMDTESVENVDEDEDEDEGEDESTADVSGNDAASGGVEMDSVPHTDAGTDDATYENDSESKSADASDKPDEKPTATIEFTPETEEQHAGDDDRDDENGDEDRGDGEKKETEGERNGLLGRIKNSIAPFAHPADGKSQLDLTDIGGVVDEQKAAVLRNAGFETVTAVYTADKDELAEVETIDETQAGYIQNGAKQTLDVSDVPLPEKSGESEIDSEDEDGFESTESTDPPTEDSQPPESPLDAESDDVDDVVVEGNDDSPHPVLTDIREVGDDRADDLREAGYESVGDVAAVGQSTLTEVRGIGGKRAETISASATDLLEQADQANGTTAEGD